MLRFYLIRKIDDSSVHHSKFIIWYPSFFVTHFSTYIVLLHLLESITKNVYYTLFVPSFRAFKKNPKCQHHVCAKGIAKVSVYSNHLTINAADVACFKQKCKFYCGCPKLLRRLILQQGGLSKTLKMLSIENMDEEKWQKK